MDQTERAWHNSFKPHFTNSGKMIYKTSLRGEASWSETPLAKDGDSILAMGQHKDNKVSSRKDLIEGTNSRSQSYDLASALSLCDVKTSADAVPEVQHKKLPFSQLASQLKNADRSVVDTYDLAHILFDDYEDNFTQGLNKSLQKQFKERIQRDRLIRFLAQYNHGKLNANIESTEQSDPLRAAVLRLIAHDIKGACHLLKDQKTYRLMLAVSQLDSADLAFMDSARLQIDSWRQQKSLSEFNLDIRTLYEICAGNVASCKGTEGVPVEDRAETFTISQRYGLGWVQCFALGLFYGREEKDNHIGVSTIKDAVIAFHGRCERGEEPCKPAEDDAMWALLQYYASTFLPDEEGQSTVPHPSFPACLGSLAKSWDHSDLFNFYQAMAANTIFVKSLLKHDDIARVDQLAEEVASELSTKEDIASAIYALIHITDVETRKASIQDLLDRFASSLPGPDTATSNAGIELWTRLTMDLKVPQSWLYMAKARYAASATNNGGDNISELRYLVAAEAWESSHDCLLKRVAPAFTIDQDWTGLLEMCRLFGDDPASKVPGWYDGGAVYQTFANLMTSNIAKTDIETISGLRKKLVTLGFRNAKAPRLSQLSNHEREEHIAIKEMANGLAHFAMQGGNVGSLKEILELPITQDVRAEVGMALSGEKHVEPSQEKVTSASTSASASAAGKSTTSGTKGRGTASASAMGRSRRRQAVNDTEMGEADEVEPTA